MRRSLIAFAVVVYAAFLVRYMSFAAGGADSSGYLNAGKLISEGRLNVRATEMDVMGLDNSWLVFFQPLGFAQSFRPKTIVPSYPLGYPLLLAPIGRIGGWDHAPFYVVPLCALITLFVVYRLARELGLDDEGAIASAALLALSPGWNVQTLQPMSDVVATLFCAIAMLYAFRGRAILAGAAFGFAVWVRPTDALLAIAIGFALRWQWRKLALAAAAAIPFAIGLLIVNQTLYGGLFKTGYGSFAELLSLAMFRVCAVNQAKALAMTLPIFPIALFARRAALLTWFAAFFLFYSFYSVCDDWSYVRFLLPAFPALIIGALLVLRNVAVRRAVIAAAAIAMIVFTIRSPLRTMHDQEIAYTHAVHWSQKHLPPNALVAVMQFGGAYYFYTDHLSVQYEWLKPDKFQELRAYAGYAGFKFYALVFDWEEDELFKHMPGKWTKVDRMRNVDLLRLDD